jgi:hypothetical protein
MNAKDAIFWILEIQKNHRNAIPEQQLKYTHYSEDEFDARKKIDLYLRNVCAKNNESDIFVAIYHAFTERVNHSRRLGFSFNFVHYVVISTHDFIEYDVKVV